MDKLRTSPPVLVACNDLLRWATGVAVMPPPAGAGLKKARLWSGFMTAFCSPPRLIAVCLLVLLLPGGANAQGNCDEALAQHDAAVRARALDDAAARAIAIQTDPKCEPGSQRSVGRRTVLLHVAIANQNLKGGQSLSEQELLLQRGLKFGEVWQALAMMGDARNASKDYAAATEFYQRALNDMNDVSSGSQEPPSTVIERVVRLAQQTRMLAPDAPPVKTRAGDPGGLGLTRVRGLQITRVPQPIQFHFGEARMTESGVKQAQFLAETLGQQGQPNIKLVGHTDPKGSMDINLRLSFERARVLQKFLQDRGYNGRIEVDGKGPTEPIEIEDREAYSEQQQHQILRRVDLVRQ
jgi:OmpA-OmpF porin, OOP family